MHYLCQANIYRKQGNEVTNDIVQAPVVLLVTLHKSFIGTAKFYDTISSWKYVPFEQMSFLTVKFLHR